MFGTFYHTPVLCNSVLSVLDPREGECVLDVTVGLGGHASAFLERVGRQGRLIGLDADEANLSLARERLTPWRDSVTLVHANFRDIATLGLPNVDVVFADLGLSSPHVDDPERGLTFRQDVPLDLRFDRTKGQTAAEWLRSISVDDLLRAFRDFGEIRGARRLAEVLKNRVVRSTFDVVRAAHDTFGWRSKAILPQIFQALRIAVNGEMDSLECLLRGGPPLLTSRGRMGVISYHSLEDRLVKQHFRSLTIPVRDPETGAVALPTVYTLLTRKALTPSPEECAGNPRARSAKFRAIIKAPVLHS